MIVWVLNGVSPGKGRLVDAFHMVLVEGTLVPPCTVRDKRHGYSIGSSQSVDKRIGLESFWGPNAWRGLDELVAECSVNVLAAGGELGPAGLLDTCHNLKMHPSFGVYKGDFVDDRFHHLEICGVNVFDYIDVAVELIRYGQASTSLSMR